ncbi:MAG: Pyrrolo-quinoline quinone, partial [Verrucomicrobia bacterium]
EKLWSYEIGKPVGSSPAVSDGKIVIGSDDGIVYCFGPKRVK